MKWKKINEYAIESDCGKWRISKAYLDGCTMYALHQNGGDAVKYSEDSSDLKEAAEHAKA